MFNFTRNFQARLRSGHAMLYTHHILGEFQLLLVHFNTWLCLLLVLAILVAGR